MGALHGCWGVVDVVAAHAAAGTKELAFLRKAGKRAMCCLGSIGFSNLLLDSRLDYLPPGRPSSVASDRTTTWIMVPRLQILVDNSPSRLVGGYLYGPIL